MRGRAKGERERTIILAHQTEAMARQKVLKPLGKYLEPPKAKKKGNSAVIAMLTGLHRKQSKERPDG